MSNDISILTGNIYAKIYDWSSDESWKKTFNVSEVNEKIMKEAVDLIYQNKYDLVFLSLFKGIEAEAKRLIKNSEIRPEKLITALREHKLISDREYHFFNGLRSVRNLIAHGHPDELDESNRIFLENEIKIGILMEIILLMYLQSKSKNDTLNLS